MDTIRLDLPKLKTQEAALKAFGEWKNMPEYYSENLDSLYEILSQWTNDLKIEIVVGTNLAPLANLMGMLEDARKENDKLLFVVIMEN